MPMISVIATLFPSYCGCPPQYFWQVYASDQQSNYPHSRYNHN